MLSAYRTLAATGKILGVSEAKVRQLIYFGPLVGRTMPEGLMVHDDDLRDFRRPRASNATTSDNLSQCGSEMLRSAQLAATTNNPASTCFVAADYASVGQCERWAWVPGSDRHEVSTLGHIRSWRVGKHSLVLPAPVEVTPRAIAGGYLGFAKQSRLHWAVLTAFVGPCPLGFEGSHRNGDKHDNRLENLRWATHAENIADKRRHGTLSKRAKPNLGASAAAEIRRRREAGESRASVADAFGVTPQTISHKTRAPHESHLKVCR